MRLAYNENQGNKFGPITIHLTKNADQAILARKHPDQKTPLTAPQLMDYLNEVLIAELEALDKEGRGAVMAARLKELVEQIEERQAEDEADKDELLELRYSLAGAKREASEAEPSRNEPLGREAAEDE